MRPRARAPIALAVAGIAGGALAISIGTAGAASPTTVTLGSTTGSPTQNICGSPCTYVPFNNVEAPALQVPADGTVRSFSVNSGSAGNVVELRVLRPAAGGKFRGAGTSPMETLSGGVSTFTVNLPVQAGDVLGLDNGSSAIVFDTTSSTPITAYYDPSLADGATAAPNDVKTGFRLLLSATVQESSSSTTTTTGTSTGTTTSTTSHRAAITNLSESHSAWREHGKRGRHKPPIGTVFSFRLSEQARVTLSFFRQLGGRSVRGSCVAPTRSNRHAAACTRAPAAGSLSIAERAGADRVSFGGRVSGGHELKPGSYTVLISATNGAQQPSNAASLAFAISSK